MNDNEFWLQTAFDLLDQIRICPRSNTTWTTTRCEDVPSHNQVNMPAVKSVIFNKEATIVYFDDGTKCIVRKSAKDEYNREHAVVYAIVKRAYGTVDENGVVQGNGMGSMLEKVVENGYDQEAHAIAEKNKKIAKRDAQRKTQFVESKNHEKETIRPWDMHVSMNRDSKGRFVKKSNRK